MTITHMPQSSIQHPASRIELLDAPPPTMRRPLARIGDHTYAAVWLYVRSTASTPSSPLEQPHLQRFIVRDDGVLFGEGGDCSLQDLGIAVHLPEIPAQSRTWSAVGVKAYCTGTRPDPIAVFQRITAVVDRFVDFDHSLAGQQTMAELIACYSLTTWFLPAFNVIGYLCPTGERGSGKTVLLHTIAAIAYLGHVLPPGSSYASLRDLAEYGATLAFDDAENLIRPHGLGGEQRALLLAGNRRGSTLTVKERGPGNLQRLRHINAFCPRLFSAIQPPDNVLASRSIVIPLVRTADRDCANADPLDDEAWPHDRRRLLDDLWALALAHLAELPPYTKAVSEKATLAGRDLEPWRAILAVALWLDAHDTEGVLKRAPGTNIAATADPLPPIGLWNRLHTLSRRYQQEKQHLAADDITSLVVSGLCLCCRVKCATSATSATNVDIPTLREILLDPEIPVTSESVVLTTQQICAYAQALALRQGTGTETITETRVGRTLGRLRLQKAPRPGGKGSRRWRVTLDQAHRLARAYGLALTPSFPPTGANTKGGSS